MRTDRQRELARAEYYRRKKRLGHVPHSKKQAECHPDRPYKSRGKCNACANLEWRKSNHDKYLTQARRQNASEAGKLRVRRFALNKYGITEEQYQSMLSMGGGGCWICGRPPKSRRLAVEHAHDKSKRVRGLACYVCNNFRVGMNTLETAKAVVKYLESDFDGRDIGKETY